MTREPLPNRSHTICTKGETSEYVHNSFARADMHVLSFSGRSKRMDGSASTFFHVCTRLAALSSCVCVCVACACRHTQIHIPTTVAVSFHPSGQPSLYSGSYASMSGPTMSSFFWTPAIFVLIGFGVWGRHQAICICAVIVVELSALRDL